MEAVTIKDLTFTYAGAREPALRQLSLTLPAGSFTLLCGPSGCGKTTLLRLLKKKLAPAGQRSGCILFGDRDWENLDERQQAADIGFVMQNPENQIVTDKVWHELAFGLENLGIPPAVIKRRVGEICGFFGIADWFHADTASLSGGQKQLLNLAAVMIMQPGLLLLDEPTAQLDPIAASSFLGALERINRELGTTILLIEHRLEEALPMADQAAVMDGGHILLTAPPREAAGRIGSLCPALAGGLPCALRIFGGRIDPPPLTVREGRAALQKAFPAPAVPALSPRPPREAPPALELRDVWFRFEKDGPDVLKGAGFAVKQGETFALLGDNGAGKSTLLSVIAGLRRPYRGRVLAEGKDVRQYKNGSLYRILACLPQNPQTVFACDSLEAEFAEMQRHLPDAGVAAKQAERLCDTFGLSELLGRHPYDLSGGEQQKAALVKILLARPRILLLDEPTKGMDPAAKADFARILAGLKKHGITILLVTHDVDFAAETADRCGLLFDGAAAGIDTPEAFFSGNYFYTTAASRISRGTFAGAVTAGQVLDLCRQNGGPKWQK